MGKLKLLGSAASAASKAGWLSKIFAGSKAFLAGAGRFVANPWVQAAFLGWEVYDYFSNSDDPEDAGSIIADAGRSKDITTVLYPPTVLRALTNGVSDSQALSQAFTSCFLKSSASTDPLARLRSGSYAVMADYLNNAPDLNTLIYSADKTSDLLAELSDVIAAGMGGDEAAELKGLDLSAKDVASSPAEARKVLDFTAHLVSQFKEEVTNE